MRLGLISPKEKVLLKNIEVNNDSEVAIWKVNNIVIPISTIILTILAAIKFKDYSSDAMTYFALLINGSIPMIALNRVNSMGVYLFKYDRSKEAAYGIEDTYWLRTKIGLMIIGIIICSIIIYIDQVLHSPPKNFNWWQLISLALSLFMVYSSIQISKRVYLLQDKLIDKTFDQQIRTEAKDKGHGKNW